MKSLGNSIRPVTYSDPDASCGRTTLWLLAMIVLLSLCSGVFVYKASNPSISQKNKQGFELDLEWIQEKFWEADLVCPCESVPKFGQFLNLSATSSSMLQWCYSSLALFDYLCEDLVDEVVEGWGKTSTSSAIFLESSYLMDWVIMDFEWEWCYEKVWEFAFKLDRQRDFFILEGSNNSIWEWGGPVDNAMDAILEFDCTISEPDLKDWNTTVYDKYFVSCNPKTCSWFESQNYWDIFLETFAVAGSINTVAILVAGLIYSLYAKKKYAKDPKLEEDINTGINTEMEDTEKPDE